MSVNSKMTALADKTRILGGLSGTLGIDQMTTEVAAANTEIVSQMSTIAQIKSALNGKTGASGTGVNKLPQLLNKTITAISEDDFGGATLIDSHAFARCSQLVSVEIPDTVTKIEQYAFISCVKLKELIVPDSVTTIGLWCFSYLSELETLKLPSNITTLPEGAVCDCLKLSYLEIPASVTSIGGYQRCGQSVGGATIAVKAQTPPTLASNHRWDTSVQKIIVPQGTLSAYQSATNWSALADLMEESTEW